MGLLFFVPSHPGSSEKSNSGLQCKQFTDADQENLSRNATILLLAGSETTATTLSGATYFLLSHPHILERLKQEIRTTFSSPDEITISSVSKLSYILAVLNETLRCYPPLTAGMVRVVPPEGADIAGQYVPQGVGVHLSITCNTDEPSMAEH